MNSVNVLMISGSRNPQGQTAKAADASLDGAAGAGAQVETVFLPLRGMERCRQCEDNGWGKCRAEGWCVIEDDFAGLVQKIRAADMVVFATPVYYSDLSESIRAFTDRLRRMCMHEAGKAGIEGKLAIGICVAGGGGGGAPACCASLERVLARCGFDLVDVVPVRRQNLQWKLRVMKLIGGKSSGLVSTT